MKFDAKDFTDEELKSVIAICETFIKLRNTLHSKLKPAANITAETVIVPKTSKVAPKWKHKGDSNLTWSGRGRTPKWIKKFGVKIG